MQVIDPSQDFRIIAESPLGQRCHASPAVSNGQIFIRGETDLFCIADQAESPE